MVIPFFRCLPVPVGRMQIFVDLRDPDARDLLMQAPIRPELVFGNDWAVFRRCIAPDSHVLDVGANYGVFAAAISQLLSAEGSITCFEPHPLLKKLLCKMAESSDDALIAVVGDALSDSCGAARFYEAKASSNSSLGKWKTIERDEPMTLTECQTTTLDIWIESSGAAPPAFLKCDVEGAELLVFQGARRTLNRDTAPVIYFEQNIHTVRGLGIGQFAAAEFLLSLERPRFRLFQAAGDGRLSAFSFQPQDHVNLFAIPENEVRKVTG